MRSIAENSGQNSFSRISASAGPSRKETTVSDVAQYCVANRQFQLREKLVGQDKVQPVFPQFRKHVGEAGGRVGRELVQVEVKIAALLFSRLGATERGEAETRDEQGAK